MAVEIDEGEYLGLLAERDSLRNHVAELESALAKSASREAALVDKADALRMQAQIWKGEARGQTSTVLECYQLCTGATGEPGDWNGANPVRELVAERDALVEKLKVAEAALVSVNRAAADGQAFDAFVISRAALAKIKEAS